MTPGPLPPLPLPVERWKRIAEQLGLSPQQRRVAELILRHQCDKQIAQALRISQPTVRTHISRMFVRVGVGDREELILAVFRMASALCRCG